jgi:RND family efflux transporter MFP subunit
VTGCHSGSGAPSDKDPAADPVAVEMVDAAVKSMEVTLSAQGTLAAGQGASARVAAVAPGHITSVLVREGQHVTAGQIVAVVDSRPQQAQARSAAAALSAAQTQAGEAAIAARAAALNQSNAIHVAQLSLESAQIDDAANVKQAQTALQSAQTDLARIRTGARPQEIAQADQNVVQDKATRDRATKELNRVQFLFDKGVAAQRQLDDAQTALAVAESTLEGAQQQANLVRAGARPEEIRMAELRVQQAQEALQQAQAGGKAKIAQARAALQQAEQSALDVEAKRQEVQIARQTAAQRLADLSAAQATASYSELRAPLSGIVIHRNANPGDIADPASPILEIANTHFLNLLSNLPAQDGAQVATGMAARVSVPDFPAKTFAGRVIAVGQVDPQTNLLAVRIAVDDPAGQLKVGSFATADIVVSTHPKAVVVPKQAVVNHDGKSAVFVVDAENTAHQRDVETGAEQAGSVEVVKGVAAGDHVIRLGQYELSDGAKVKPAEAADKEKPGADDKKDADKKDADDKAADKGKEADSGGKAAASPKSGDEKP